MQVRRLVGRKRYVIELSPFVSRTRMKRVVEQELLDASNDTPQEIECSLRSIGRVNRRFGGDSLHARLLGRALASAPHPHKPHILEVASGHAAVLQGALRRLRARVEVTLLDRRSHHLPDVREWPTEWTPRLVRGDALALPFANASADIVSCCLFLHHLEPPGVMRFLAEATRVARLAVVINDLERTAIHYRLARMYSHFDPSRLSRHDGPVSVRRAYTFRELAGMLAASGFRFSLERAYLFRLGAIVWCGASDRLNAPGIPSPRSRSAVCPAEAA